MVPNAALEVPLGGLPPLRTPSRGFASPWLAAGDAAATAVSVGEGVLTEAGTGVVVGTAAVETGAVEGAGAAAA